MSGVSNSVDVVKEEQPVGRRTLGEIINEYEAACRALESASEIVGPNEATREACTQQNVHI